MDGSIRQRWVFITGELPIPLVGAPYFLAEVATLGNIDSSWLGLLAIMPVRRAVAEVTPEMWPLRMLAGGFRGTSPI